MKRLIFLPLAFLSLLLLASCGNTEATPQTSVAPTATSTKVPTSIPLAKQSTATPTQLQATNGIPHLGSPLSDFIGKYGQPNDHSIPSGGLYHFQRYSGSVLDFLIVQTDAADGGPYASRVEGITAQAPEAGWSQQQASAACAVFLPADRIYKRQVTLSTGTSNGYDTLYYSATIARLFPPTAFSDASTNQVQPGLFDVQYLIQKNAVVDSCSILIGTQQTQ